MLHVIQLIVAALLFESQPFSVSAQSSTLQVVAQTFNSTRQGTVIVSLNGGSYGAVCDTNWTIADATVVCRQLGFDVSSTTSVTAQTRSTYGTISLSAIMTGVNCVGTESDLSRCPYQSTVTNSALQCTNANFAGVTCFGSYLGSNSTGTASLIGCSNTSTMQLVNGTGSLLSNGRLQVSQNGVTWGTVCSSGFTLADAQVVCGALCGGVSSYAVAYPGSYYGQGLPLRVVMSNVSCTGTESSLFNCPNNGFNSSTNCTDAVGINCAAQYATLPSATLICGGNSMQLVFNQNANPIITSVVPSNTSLCQNATSWSFGTVYPSYLFSVSYYDCGTTSSVVYGTSGMPSNYLYSSTVLITATTTSSSISRSSVFQMSAVCSIQRTSTPSNSYQTGVVNLPTQASNYTVPVQATITFYADPGYAILLQPPIMVQLNSPIYVQVAVSQTAASLGYRVLVPTCLASPFLNFTAPLYYLIQNNCLNDSTTVQFTSNSPQLIQFVFNSFRFTGNYSAVYVQCTTLLCAQGDFSGLCSGQCSATSTQGRRKRDVPSQILETEVTNGPLHYSPVAASYSSGSQSSGSLVTSDGSALIDRGSSSAASIVGVADTTAAANSMAATTAAISASGSINSGTFISGLNSGLGINAANTFTVSLPAIALAVVLNTLAQKI